MTSSYRYGDDERRLVDDERRLMGSAQDVDPAEGGLGLGRIRRAVKGRVRGTPQYYERVSNKIEKEITQNRKFIFFHKHDLSQYVDYWLITARGDMDSLFLILDRLVEMDERALESMISFPGILQESVSPSANVERMIMYSSLGFVLQSRTAMPEVPPFKAIKYLHAMIFLQSRRDADMAPTDETISKMKNRVYFAALCTLKLFTQRIWTFFAYTEGSDIRPEDVIPGDAPGWFKPMLLAIERGLVTPDVEDAVDIAANAVLDACQAEKRVLLEAIEEKDQQMRRMHQELDTLRQKQAVLSDEAKDVAEMLRSCNRELVNTTDYLNESAESGEPSTLDAASRTSHQTAEHLTRAAKELDELSDAIRGTSEATQALDADIDRSLAATDLSRLVEKSERAGEAALERVTEPPPPLPERDAPSMPSRAQTEEGAVGLMLKGVLRNRRKVMEQSSSVRPPGSFSNTWTMTLERVDDDYDSSGSRFVGGRCPRTTVMSRVNKLRDFGDIMAGE